MSTGAHVRVPMRAQGTGQARQGRPFNVRYLDSKRRWLLWQRRLWYTPLHEAASKVYTVRLVYDRRYGTVRMQSAGALLRSCLRGLASQRATKLCFRLGLVGVRGTAELKGAARF
eukprot:1189762-Pyramimonas_sp.AAC.1